MKIVLDTNVFISGVFFTGSPYQILEAWRDGNVEIIISEEILDEYIRVGDRLERQFPNIDIRSIFELLTVKAEMVSASILPDQICEDPDDDKFLACAIASGAKYVVSGDKHLLKVTGYRSIEVLTPRKFVDAYLEKKIEAGAEFIQTQAVYNLDNFKKFMEYARQFPAKVLAGIILLTSAPMARFMNKNVAGVNVPQDLIDEMASAPKGRALAKGIEIAGRMIRRIREEKMCDGVHIMAIGKEELVPDIMAAAGLN